MNKTMGRWIRGVAGGLVLGTALPALAANFSFTGELLVGRQAQFFDFTLAAAASVNMRTYQYSGGTNFAGTTVISGGFDPQLHVFNLTTGAFVASNDDFFSFDSGFAALALPAGTYRVALTKFNNDPAGANLSNGFNGNTSNGFAGRRKGWALDIGNVTSAAVVAPVTAVNLACLTNTLNLLPSTSATAVAQRNALLGLVNVSRLYRGSVYDSLSTTALKTLVTRADGCGERGTPDTAQFQGGAGEDFVASCPRQDQVLACLNMPN